MRKEHIRVDEKQLEAFRAHIVYLHDVEKLSWKEVGRRLNKNHSTCIYHYKLAKKEPKRDCSFDVPEVTRKKKDYSNIIDEPMCSGYSYEEYVMRTRNDLVKKLARDTKGMRDDVRLNKFAF